jgi:hypothetical protein
LCIRRPLRKAGKSAHRNHQATQREHLRATNGTVRIAAGQGPGLRKRRDGRPSTEPDPSWCWSVPRWTPVSRERGTGAEPGRVDVVRHRTAWSRNRTRDRNLGLHGQPRSPRVATSRAGPSPVRRSGEATMAVVPSPIPGGTWCSLVGGSGRPDRERRVDLRLPGGSARCVGAQSAGGRGEIRTAEKSVGGRRCTVGESAGWWRSRPRWCSETEATVAVTRGRG